MQFIVPILLTAVFLALSEAIRRFEGDIIPDTETWKIIQDRNELFDARTERTWLNGIVPYSFDSRIDTKRRNLVQEAIKEYSKHTCVRFIPRTDERDYVRFWFGPDCSSYVGRRMYAQDLSLGKRCAKKGIIMHELMHAIGFFHEQSRLDRDKYIQILWENIMGGWDENFQKYTHGEADYLGEPYDYSSIMHYPPNAFSRNGKDTIIPLQHTSAKMGQRNGFSVIDIRQINKLYKCGYVLPTVGGTLGPLRTRTPFQHLTTLTPSGDCQDQNKRCKAWQKMGECQRNPDYMLQFCKKSCNACGDRCLDLKINCRYWAHKGECLKNPVYMKKTCKVSCKVC